MGRATLALLVSAFAAVARRALPLRVGSAVRCRVNARKRPTGTACCSVFLSEWKIAHRFLFSGVEAAARLEEETPSVVGSDANLTRDGLDVGFLLGPEGSEREGGGEEG